MRVTIFFRCSPDIGGTFRRIILPSLFGAMPRSLERIAFSMSFSIAGVERLDDELVRVGAC